MRFWKRVENDKTTTVESYSHDLDIAGAIEIDKQEFDEFVASLPMRKPEPTEVEKLTAEIDVLKVRIEKLEKK